MFCLMTEPREKGFQEGACHCRLCKVCGTGSGDPGPGFSFWGQVAGGGAGRSRGLWVEVAELWEMVGDLA